MLKLKSILARIEIKQVTLAKHCNISPAAMAQIINHNLWPKKTARVNALRELILDFLIKHRVNVSRENPFLVDGPECANTQTHDDINNQSQEDENMLLRKQSLTPAAKKLFALPRNPFDDIESAEQMWISPDIRYVRESMLQTAKHGGFLAVVGESGAGKTSVLLDLEDRIENEKLPIIIVKPYVLAAEDSDKKGKTLKSTHVAEALLRAVAPLAPIKSSPEARFAQLHKALKETHDSGYRVCLVIEEAHSMPIPTLKHLKRILELQIGFKKLVSIILIGQPELLVKLSERNGEVREVVQRCEIATLQPIEPGRLQEFLDHRLKSVEKKSNDIIDTSGIAAIANRLVSTNGASQLYPLAVGNFIVAAMNVAAVAGCPIIDAEVISEVAA